MWSCEKQTLQGQRDMKGVWGPVLAVHSIIVCVCVSVWDPDGLYWGYLERRKESYCLGNGLALKNLLTLLHPSRKTLLHKMLSYCIASCQTSSMQVWFSLGGRESWRKRNKRGEWESLKKRDRGAMQWKPVYAFAFTLLRKKSLPNEC